MAVFPVFRMSPGVDSNKAPKMKKWPLFVAFKLILPFYLNEQLKDFLNHVRPLCPVHFIQGTGIAQQKNKSRVKGRHCSGHRITNNSQA
jgi:hypothetical protein